MKHMTQEALYDLKNVAQPVVANGLVYFTQTQMNRDENRYDTHIHAYDGKTKKIRDWGDSGSYNSQIALSPDKEWLSFLSNDAPEGKTQLKVQSTTGGSALTLTTEAQGVSHYFWSADGTKLYYQTSSLTKEPSTDDKDKKLPEPTVITKTTYMLDGAGILPTDRTYHLKQVDLESREVTELASTPTPVSWHYVTKDGAVAYYTEETNVSDEWAFGRSHVYRMDLTSKDVTCLTESHAAGSFWYAGITPDESHLILMGNDFEYAFVTQNNLYRYDVASGELVNLTADLDIELGDLIVADFQQEVTGVDVTWLDGETFLFSATEEGRITVYTMTLEGGATRVFNEPVHVTGLAVVNPHKYVLTYATPTNPSSLAVYHVESHVVEDLYVPNAAFLEEVELAIPERFMYKGYADWDVHGWYLPPVARQFATETTSEQHPAVLYVHGGPQVAYGESFFHEMQALSAMGYGVIMINPRGSNSYGQAYVAAILGDYGNHDYDDLMLGVDTVLERHPEIDPDQLVVAGGSYGGFMTNWIVTHTDRFKAAVTQRSISNWISFYGTSDIGPFFVEYQLQADILHPERLWEMSPLAHVANAKTPLLVLHGQEDHRCPQEQGEQMYIAMKKVGVPTKLITFPQSSHGLSRQGLPNLRQDRLKAVTDWFAQWLEKKA